MSVNFKAFLYSITFFISASTWAMQMAPCLPLPPQEKPLEIKQKQLDILLHSVKVAVSNLKSESYKERLLVTQESLKKQYATFQCAATLKHIEFISFLLDGSVANMLGKIEHGDAAAAKSAYETLKKVCPGELSQKHLDGQDLPFIAQLETSTFLEVQQEHRAALEASCSYSELADKLAGIVEHIVACMHNSQHTMNSEFKYLIKSSMKTIERTSDPLTLVENIVKLDYVLSTLADEIIPEVSHKSLMRRPPGLLARSLEKFFKNINVIVHKRELEFVVTAIVFACDITIGSIYLTPEEYQKRIGQFWHTMGSITPSVLERLSTEGWIDGAGSCAAHVARSSGMQSLLRYLEELDLQSTMNTQASTVATMLTQNLDQFLAQHPLFVTAEGVTILGTVVNVTSLQDLVAKSKGAIREIINSVQQLASHQEFAEGLLENTTVKTLDGYVDIACLNPGDVVCGYDAAGNYYERKVIAVSSTKIPEYLALHVNGGVIRAAPYQKFRLAGTNEWIVAKYIDPKHVLVRKCNQLFSVDRVEIIPQEITVYALTVEDHEFCITEADIHVHNFNPDVVAPLILNIGAIAAINPVQALIGTAVTIAGLGYGAYKTYIKKGAHDLPLQSIPVVHLQERKFYEKRKYELILLKEKFVNALRQSGNPVGHFRSAQTASLSVRYRDQLRTLPDVLRHPFSVEQELTFNESERNALTALRAAELQLLGCSIEDLQISLLLNCHRLIEQKQCLYHDLKATSNQLLGTLNVVGTHAAQVSTSIKMYEDICRLETKIDHVRDTIKELTYTINYYKNNPASAVVKDTTTIADVLQKEAISNADIEKYIKQIEQELASHKHKLEQHLKVYGVKVAPLQSAIQNAAHKQRAQQQKEEVLRAQQEQTIGYSLPTIEKQEGGVTSEQPKTDVEMLPEAPATVPEKTQGSKEQSAPAPTIGDMGSDSPNPGMFPEDPKKPKDPSLKEAFINGVSKVGTNKQLSKWIISKAEEVQNLVKGSLGELVKHGNKIKEIYKNPFDVEHIFSKNHIRDNLLSVGSSVEDIAEITIQFIKKADCENLLKEGLGTIRTFVNGIPIEIHAFLENDTLMKINLFPGHSTKIAQNLIKF